MIEHFHEMVTKNNFIKLDLFFEQNTDPIDNIHLRYQKLTVQYYISNEAILQTYFNKQAKEMSSQVIDSLGCHYSVSRRIFELVETFYNENEVLI